MGTLSRMVKSIRVELEDGTIIEQQPDPGWYRTSAPHPETRMDPMRIRHEVWWWTDGPSIAEMTKAAAVGQRIETPLEKYQRTGIAEALDPDTYGGSAPAL